MICRCHRLRQPRPWPAPLTQRKTKGVLQGRILDSCRVKNPHPDTCHRRKQMKLMNDLFFTDYGLMSIIGIAMMVVGGAIALVVLRRKMRQDPPEVAKIRS